jgi:DNA-binding Lrp family transcriptional regulator
MDKQLQLFSDLRFTLYLSSLFTSGLAAELGVSAVVVFLVLRTHANFKNGVVVIGQRLISDQAGLTPVTTRKALAKLESKGLIKRTQAYDRARTSYQITDLVPVYNEDKTKAGVLEIPYAPDHMKTRLAHAKYALEQRRAPDGSQVTLHVDNSKTLNVQFINVSGDHAMLNISNGSGQTFTQGNLSPDLVNFFRRMMSDESE